MKAEDFAAQIYAESDPKWKNDLCPPPLDAQKALDILIDHFLGDKWYVVMPLPPKQVNTEAVYDILTKYPNPMRTGLLKRIFRT